ncbi:NAD(P)H dehydrogenase, quinone 1 [Mucor velutinosus]|uniref:rhizopuspepsin n=1 Tax=Mucor velutinosus TaxID=708070 RepID=A0AAN7DM91_9FUNG|nr:NAD(P)H dehydrogenase, quinone 1 [Mucor velutinosus]
MNMKPITYAVMAAVLCLITSNATPIERSTVDISSNDDHNRIVKLKQRGYLHGSGYTGSLGIGEHSLNTYDIVFDTGSSDFWVLSNEACISKQYCQTHHVYQPKKSINYTPYDSKRPLIIRYGTGSISAHIGRDTIQLGSATVHSQFVADAYKITNEFKNLPIDGIMGLGLPNLSKTIPSKPTLVENMVEQGLIDRAMFSVYLQAAGGEIDFGGTDPYNYRGLITYAPVVGDLYWQIEMTGASFGNYSLASRYLIMDTGTTLLLVSPKEAEMMHVQIQGARYNNDGTYSVPCHLKGALPELAIQIEGRKLAVSSNDYVLLPSDSDASMCLSGISGQNTNKPNHWIMGDVFFKAYYTVFDQENMRIGFAEARVDPTLSAEVYDDTSFNKHNDS